MPVEFEQLRERAKTWIEPIAGASPTGASAKFDQKYQAVANEMAKLDMPAGGEVNWKNVVEATGDLLRTKTKDLAIASYLAHALHRTGALDGLVTGLTLLVEMFDKFWDGMFPEVKRIRGRVNALQWFLEKTLRLLPSAQTSASALATVEALEVASRRLAEVARQRFGDQAPAMTPLLEQVERIRLAAAPPPPPPSAGTSPAAEPRPAEAAPADAVPSALPAAPAPALTGAADVPEYLRVLGDALLAAADAVRHVDSSNPASYRLLRVGLWLEVDGPPPATAGKTIIPAPAEDLRNQLAQMAQGQSWAELLEAAEAAVQMKGLALDFHRFSWQALAGLGASHGKAKDALAAEVRSLLARAPQLPGLFFEDGTPMADAQTKTWIEEEIQPQAGSGPQVQAGADGEAAAARAAEARKLLAASQVPQALALLQQGIMTSRGGRDRFLARLELARLAGGAGLAPLAKATYEELSREAAEQGIDAWEPALVAECLKGLITAARGLANDPRGASQDLAEPYARLCRLDPVAAHEVWP